ncbi:putative 3-oxoadipate enol-lactonase protein [Phaeoacremonium minimum UCRPA7]|uniref:Putative 3-oxoadipate enol-lactonase protein n=1 Tax=Phaeoacremonium minimum (strain UCR-PA7) TaxID=1286976 RepID=R8BBM8_PHAM7|nr:putative 3-oxoadipate enol-lactonase protein [Phaeoacremonium minimum UCRPA7]EON96743.1 putative 3-oxoadipate enol-lactonase protein [Phaeoacremonium minimum UCRPA7]
MAQAFQLPDGRELSYELTYVTEPQRPTVLLSNSLSAQFGFWDEVVSALHDAGFRVLLYDHPGHGKSSAPTDLGSTTFESLADDVHNLLTSKEITAAFSGHHAPRTLTPFLHAWVGVSMGAALGIFFVTKFPGMVKNLVVCDTISCSPSNAGVEDAFGPRVKAARQDGDMKKTVQSTMERWFGAEWIASHSERADVLRGLMETTTIDGFETCIAALQSPTFDVRPLAPKVASGTEHVLFVVGEKDADLPEKMKGLRDGVQDGFSAAGKSGEQVDFVVIPNAGHVSFVDGFEAFRDAVVPFLKRT